MPLDMEEADGNFEYGSDSALLAPRILRLHVWRRSGIADTLLSLRHLIDHHPDFDSARAIRGDRHSAPRRSLAGWLSGR